MDFYRIKVDITIEKYSYGELDSRRESEITYKLEDCDELKGLIVKDGILVGVMLSTSFGAINACLPGQYVNTYYASDDDGTGSSDRDDVCSLVCIV